MALKEVAGLLFDWDDAKSDRNWRNRKLDFEAAIDAFFDERALVSGNMEWRGEERYQLIAQIPVVGIIVVLYTIWQLEGTDEKVCRIISARLANSSERKDYLAQSEPI